MPSDEPCCWSCFGSGQYRDDTGCRDIWWYCDCPAGLNLRKADDE